MRIGLAVWPAFIVLDVFMCFVVFPAAPFGRFLLFRIVVEACLWVVYRMSLRPDVPLGRLSLCQNLTFFAAALAVSVMALDLGGPTSAYVHGLSIVLLVRATVLPESWRRAIFTSAPIALVFPAVMAVAAAFWPEVRADWNTGASLARFASHYVFVVATAVIGTVARNTVWAAREQAYRARRCGRFRLQAPIGRGGMGEVWLAWDDEKRQNLVIKLLRAEQTPDPIAVRRFEREARAASRLTSPHTIRIFDFGASDDGLYYVAMEYLQGSDLDALVRTHGVLAPARAIHLGMQACESLDEAHAAGIVHRDIKPSNLFVTRAGDEYDVLKVLDFGLARLAGADESTQLTRTGWLLGTPAYVAPELWQGHDADARSDLYALGATLYFLLTGAAPFQADTQAAFLAAHLRQAPRPPSERAREPVPPSLDAVVLRCLAKDVGERFQSAAELRAALAAIDVVPAWTADDAR